MWEELLEVALTSDIGLLLAILAAAMVLFSFEWVPADVVALGFLVVLITRRRPWSSYRWRCRPPASWASIRGRSVLMGAMAVYLVLLVWPL